MTIVTVTRDVTGNADVTLAPLPKANRYAFAMRFANESASKSIVLAEQSKALVTMEIWRRFSGDDQFTRRGCERSRICARAMENNLPTPRAPIAGGLQLLAKHTKPPVAFERVTGTTGKTRASGMLWNNRLGYTTVSERFGKVNHGVNQIASELCPQGNGHFPDQTDNPGGGMIDRGRLAARRTAGDVCKGGSLSIARDCYLDLNDGTAMTLPLTS